MPWDINHKLKTRVFHFNLIHPINWRHNTISHVQFVLHKTTIALKCMSYINRKFLEEVLLRTTTLNVPEEWGKAEMKAWTCPGWVYFKSLSFTILLLYHFFFFHLLNCYSSFLSRFFNENPILLVVDDL